MLYIIYIYANLFLNITLTFYIYSKIVAYDTYYNINMEVTFDKIICLKLPIYHIKNSVLIYW